MKVRASVKKICKKCKFTRRKSKNKKGGATLGIRCEDKRHNQRQG